MNATGYNFIVNLDEEIALLVSEAREQKVGDNDLHKLFFTYLVKVVYNNSSFKTIDYTTTSSAITLLDEIVGLIIKDHLDLPEQEHNQLITNVTKLQEALAINEKLMNAIATGVLTKVYNKFLVNGNVVELTPDDNLALIHIDVQVGYTWSSHKFITKATIKLNLQ